MTLQEICYWMHRTLMDRGWWFNIVGASGATISLVLLYANVLITPVSGEYANVTWQYLTENSFMAWVFELFTFAVGASLVTGRNWASGSHTVYAWLFPWRYGSALAIVSGVGAPTMCIAAACSTATHILLAGFPADTSAHPLVSGTMILTSSISALFASALGVSLTVLTRSTTVSIISMAVLFWFVPGVLVAADLPASFLPSASLMNLTLLPLRNGSVELLVGIGSIFLVLIVAGIVESRRDIQ